MSALIGSLLIALIGLAAMVISALIGIQRLHDIGWSGWLLLLTFVPVVGGIFALLMMFIPGSNGVNRFGPPPPPNSTAVKVLGLLWLAVPVLGVLVAIALPAYQDYLNRSGL